MKIKSIRHFTLLELLITTSLIGLLMVTVFSVSANIMVKWEALSESNAVFEEVLTIEKVLDNSIPNAIPFIWRDKDETIKRVNTFKGETDRLTFCYLHRVDDPEEGALRFIGFTLEDEQLVAYYQDRPYLNFDELDDNVVRSVLAEGVASIEFQYVKAEKGDEEDKLDWVREWDTEDDEYFDIPLGIRMDITWVEDEITETFFYRTAGNSRYERWGSWEPRKPTEGWGGTVGGDTEDKDGGKIPGDGDGPPPI